MFIEVSAASIVDRDVDAIVVNLFEGVTDPGGATGAVDTAAGGLISNALAASSFSGQVGRSIALWTGGRIPARWIIVVGLGPTDKFGAAEIRHASGVAIAEAKRLGVRTMATIVHGAGVGGIEPSVAARALVEGALMAAHQYRDLKTPSEDDNGPETELERLVVVEADGDKIDAITSGVNRGSVVGEAINCARKLVLMPANLMGPAEFADLALEMSNRLPLTVEVLDEDELTRQGLNLITTVGRGSVRRPRMVVCTYRGRGSDEIDIALVGKGIMFDSGGIQVKPSTGMDEMKGDMAGAAAVLMTLSVAAELKLPVNVMAVVPAVENLISGDAFRPGDVIVSYAGKTVEILETDAEGRLVLADAVAWAERRGAKLIVDVATLTGACVSALGNLVTGLFSNDHTLRDGLLTSGNEAGERAWEMPLVDEYRRRLRSDVADLKNHDGTQGSLIISAMFIGAFVDSVPWAHLDIAGTASIQRPHRWYVTKGPTGVPVGTLVRLLERLAAGGGTL